MKKDIRDIIKKQPENPEILEKIKHLAGENLNDPDTLANIAYSYGVIQAKQQERAKHK